MNDMNDALSDPVREARGIKNGLILALFFWLALAGIVWGFVTIWAAIV